MHGCDPNTSDAGSGGGILLVDDEPALLEIYSAILSRYFPIATAGNASQADALLREKAFKVIVADHLMPGENGLSFLARVRREFPHTQRVLVTGSMTPDMRRKAAESDLLFAFLEKPVSLAHFVNVVKSAAQVHDIALAAAK
jgi:DNA-binding NtrC family response regulator